MCDLDSESIDLFCRRFEPVMDINNRVKWVLYQNTTMPLFYTFDPYPNVIGTSNTIAHNFRARLVNQVHPKIMCIVKMVILATINF